MNYLFIFILLLVIIIILYMCTFYNTNKNKYLLSNKNQDIEQFESQFDFLKINYNLISNNSFQDGNPLSNFINQNGFNQIIKYKNPGKSPFVLHQKKNSLYEISSSFIKPLFGSLPFATISIIAANDAAVVQEIALHFFPWISIG